MCKIFTKNIFINDISPTDNSVFDLVLLKSTYLPSFSFYSMTGDRVSKCWKFNAEKIETVLKWRSSSFYGPPCCRTWGYQSINIATRHNLKGEVRPGRDIAFYANKIGQKLAEIWCVQYNSLKNDFIYISNPQHARLSNQK